jgi:hypothetical protein
MEDCCVSYLLELTLARPPESEDWVQAAFFTPFSGSIIFWGISPGMLCRKILKLCADEMDGH